MFITKQFSTACFIQNESSYQFQKSTGTRTKIGVYQTLHLKNIYKYKIV